MEEKQLMSHLEIGSVVYTTGAYIEWTGAEWKVLSLEDDTYFGGLLVQDKANKPYIERVE